MKKLISAAASLAMAASMLGSAVPFATGAADASKSLEIRPFLTPAGTEASTTISAADIAAGAVTVPVGVYIVEGTNDCESIASQFTVNSKNGDASKVKFSSASYTQDYFSAAQTYSKGDASVSTKRYATFDGKFDYDEVEEEYSLSRCGSSNGQYLTAESSKAAKTPNAFASGVWISADNGTGYTYLGSKSDDYPIYVINVEFAQGTPAGEYTLDFCDYNSDPEHPETYSNMIEVGSTKYTTKNSNLTLKGLTITVEGDAQDTTTTTTATTTKDTPTTTTTVVTTTNGGGTDEFPVKADYIVKPEQTEYKANPGEKVKVVYYVDPGSNPSSMLVAEYNMDSLPAGAKIVNSSKAEASLSGNAWSPQVNAEGITTLYLNTLVGGEPSMIDKDTAILTYSITIPADAADGEYELDFNRFHVVGANNKDEFDATRQTAKLIIGDGGTETTTTTTATTTTATTTKATTTTTATTTKKPGDPDWGDSNCDGKVNVADVVVLNKWLNDAKSYNLTDQGKLNADCYAPKNGEGLDSLDSDAIIQSIVHLVTLPVQG